MKHQGFYLRCHLKNPPEDRASAQWEVDLQVITLTLQFKGKLFYLASCGQTIADGNPSIGNITEISNIPDPSHWLNPALTLPPPDSRPLSRRASHAGNLGQRGHQPGEDPDAWSKQDFLNVPKTRSRGSSLPDNISTEELYRLR